MKIKKTMANPQPNEFTKISNEILDALCKIRIPGQARQVLDFILRKTYGWNKKTDQISLYTFVEGTNLSKVAICKNIKKLVGMNIITQKGNAMSRFTQKGNDVIITYGFQKDYDKWNALPKKVTLPKKVIHVTQKGKETLPKKVIASIYKQKKLYTKETIIKESIYSKKEEKFNLFWDIFGWKRGRSKALEAFMKINLTDDVFEKILSGAKAYAQHRLALIAKDSTPKMAQGWLNDRRWEDEITEYQEQLSEDKLSRYQNAKRYFKRGNMAFFEKYCKKNQFNVKDVKKWIETSSNQK